MILRPKFFFFFLIILLFQYKPCIGQEYKLIAKIDTLAKLATADNFGNFFIVSTQNEVLKFNAKGELLWNYTNKTFGNISEIDVTDPLRVILYYPAFQQIIVLNNNLNEISRFSFNNSPNQQITLVASANNNGFWIYDQLNRELKKLTNNFTDDLKSGNIYQRDGFDMNANYMINDNQYVYINDLGNGVRIFDRFGNFFKTAVINVQTSFSVTDNVIIYQKGADLYSYNYLSFEDKKIKTPAVSESAKMILTNNRLLILTEKGLTLWAFTEQVKR